MTDTLDDCLDERADASADDAGGTADRIDGRLVNSALLYAARAYGG